MEKKDTLSKVLTVAGTVLVWFPILAPVILGFFPLVSDGIYRFDYLMPAELGVLVFVGGASLIWGSLRSGSRRRVIFWGFGLSAISAAVLMALGDVVPGSLEWALAIGLLATYTLGILVMGVGGILLWRDLFGK
jgi:hypothetical protein